MFIDVTRHGGEAVAFCDYAFFEGSYIEFLEGGSGKAEHFTSETEISEIGKQYIFCTIT
jgi:glutamine amidotransferase-like uncharacterized protein